MINVWGSRGQPLETISIVASSSFRQIVLHDHPPSVCETDGLGFHFVLLSRQTLKECLQLVSQGVVGVGSTGEKPEQVQSSGSTAEREISYERLYKFTLT
jgi:hypothetical protein